MHASHFLILLAKVSGSDVLIFPFQHHYEFLSAMHIYMQILHIHYCVITARNFKF